MVGLLSLPDELLTEIYIFAGQQTRALVRLSAVNRRLRAIWLQDADFIIAQVVQLKAPNHQDAIALTLLEIRCPVPVRGFHTLDESYQGPPLRLCLPPLMRNLDLASAVCSQLPLEIADGRRLCKGTNDPYWGPPMCPLEPLYYLVRTACVAFHYWQLRPSLYAALKALSDEALRCIDKMDKVLASPKRVTRPHAHSRFKPVSEFTRDELYERDFEGWRWFLTAMWDFALSVGSKVAYDREDGLEEDPGEYFEPCGGRIDFGEDAW
jgi:hypothetical protein